MPFADSPLDNVINEALEFYGNQQRQLLGRDGTTK